MGSGAGNIKAVATLTEEQINKIHTEEKGDVLVNVKVGTALLECGCVRWLERDLPDLLCLCGW